MNYLLNPVSIFNSVRETTPSQTARLIDVILSAEWLEQVEQVRREQDPDQKKQLKAALPIFTPAGLFSRHTDDALTAASNVICLDIDAKDNLHVRDFADLPRILTDTRCPLSRHVLYIGHSVGGEGFFVLMPIIDPSQYAGHYKAIGEAFEGYGVKVDKSCCNISRARFVSFETLPYVNPYAEPWTKVWTPAPRPENKQFKASPSPSQPMGRDLTFEQVVAAIDRTGLDITNDYADWLQVGCACAALGERGRDYFHTISRQNAKYKQAECDQKFSSLLHNPANGNTGLPTLIYLARKFNPQIF